MTRVAIVTDSTASLPPELLGDGDGVTVVPLHVVVDGEDHHDDGVSITRGDLAERMRDGARVTTSQPASRELARAMRDAVERGAQAVVAVHLSGELSGTAAQSRVAAAEVTAATGVPVHVVDTRTTAGGLGLAVVAAAEAAAGGDVHRVLAVAREVGARSRVLFMVPDLQHLAHGGRMSAARASIGAALGVRPILTMVSGRIVVAELVRGAVRARRQLVELAARAAGGPGAAVPRGDGAPVRLVVHHFDAQDAAAELATALRERLQETGAMIDRLVIGEVTAVVGAHTGPGVVGVALAPLPR
ncbi:DegV family protein [Georgenia sunbinii]|uniref:DegV family protein n=1 Tax=Georgenia sunbinii TaxID=3117728 RepID=UPI002F269A67